MRSRVLIVLIVLSASSSAGAEESEHPPAWRYSVDIVNRLVALGHEPVFIVEDGATEPYVAAERQQMRIAIRGRLRAESRHFRLDVEPYTVVPDDAFRVNAAGVELNALLPVEGFGYVGFYHHSSHNFNFRGFGYGINLNAVVVDARRFEKWRFLDEEADVQLRFLFHGYPIGDGPAHVLTANSVVEPGAAGTTTWRADLDAVVGHPKVRAECGVSFASGGTAPDSARVSCAGLYAVGSWLGEWGERLFIGPYASGGVNFTQTETFGIGAYSLGIRVDIVLAENAFLR